jgi:hypothetical protein
MTWVKFTSEFVEVLINLEFLQPEETSSRVGNEVVSTPGLVFMI